MTSTPFELNRQLQINPSRKLVDFIKLKQITKNFIKKEEDRTEDPQKNQQFSEENVFDITINKTIKLYTYREKSKSTPKALLIINHGLNSHANRFGHIAKFFA